MGIIVGGLGGGGDIGLAAVIVEDSGLADSVAAVLSFARCDSRRVPDGLERVEGALYRVIPDAYLGRRFFEDKLYRITAWARRVYVVCALDEWGNIVRGLDWVAENSHVSCMLHTDIGGDGLLTGYEQGLGSYKVDTVAKAALAHAAEEHGWRSYVAVGAAGGEGGGGEISVEDLAATLSLLDQKGAIVGAVVPRRESLVVADILLAEADSGMLPLYLHAARGAVKARIRRAYLRGEYHIEKWYRYIIVLDTVKACSISPLCRAARDKGVRGISRWKTPGQRMDEKGARIYFTVKNSIGRRGRKYAENTIMEILEKHSRVWYNPLLACRN